MFCTYIQIYKERIYDLLNPAQLNSSNPGLKLRWSKANEFYVENLYNYPCETAQDVINHFHTGLKNKVMASHNLNSASSRSHSILTITVETMEQSGEIITSRLQLVDLAGSERQSFTGNEGEALKESIEINKSLFTLRQVISSLSSQRDGEATFIPYRDSKLTSLLKQSIGGNSFCLMIACIAPSDQYFDENVSTLTYATKTAHIANEPVQNLDPKTRVVKDMQNEIKELNSELKKAYQQIDILTDMIVDSRETSFNQKLMELEKIPLKGNAMDLIRAASSNKRSLTSPAQQLITPQKSARAVPSAQPATLSASDSLPTPILSASSEKAPAGSLELTPQILSEKLYDSVKMIRDLMASNRTLKETINEFSQSRRRAEVEIKQLTIDNQELKERVEMLESLLGDRYPASSDSLPNYIQLKRERDDLRVRVRQLELENGNIQNMFRTQASIAAPPPLGPKGELTWKSKRTIIRPRNVSESAYSAQYDRSQEVTKNVKQLTPLKPLNVGRESPPRRVESNQDRGRRTHSSHSVEGDEPMSKDDALKALSQLLLNRAAYTKYKSSSSRPL